MKTSIIFAICSLSVLFGAEQSLKVNPDTSSIKAHVKATGHSFEAVVRSFNSQVMVDSETGTPLKADVSFSVLDLDTDNDKRNTEMLHWMNSDHFPKITFHFDSWKNESHKIALGTLSIHGVDQSVEVPLTYRKENGSVVIEGTCRIDTTHFKLEVIKKMLFLKVDPVLNIEFRLEGNLES